MVDLNHAFQTQFEKEARFKALVIGDPVSHSLSPQVHAFWLSEFNIDGAYGRLHIIPDQLRDFVQTLRHSNIVGCNVTLPHKEKMLDLVDDVTLTAQVIGAVNMLYFQGDRLMGDNTDAYGFSANLDASYSAWDKKRGEQNKALILGAGGAARSVIYALLHRHFDKILIANRTLARAEQLCADFLKLTAQHKSTISIVDVADLASIDDELDLVVNTTSLGMDHHQDALHKLPFDLNIENLAKANPHLCVTDIVYTPLQTPLLKKAKAAKLVTVDGLGMLLHQAVPGFIQWFEQKPNVSKPLRYHILARLKEQA